MRRKWIYGNQEAPGLRILQLANEPLIGCRTLEKLVQKNYIDLFEIEKWKDFHVILNSITTSFILSTDYLFSEWCINTESNIKWQ